MRDMFMQSQSLPSRNLLSTYRVFSESEMVIIV